MPRLKVEAVMRDVATEQLFGGNLLATRSEMNGPGGYKELIEDLGVDGLRYPGGSLTEDYFDISNPNAEVVYDRETGEPQEFIPLNDFLSGASDIGAAVTIVLPTRHLLTEERDENGNRFADVDEEELREFIYSVVTGEHGNADIAAFEIGNEYWGAGRMSTVEYARVSKEMADIIDSEIKFVEETTGASISADTLVQMGTNFSHANLSGKYDDGQSSQEIVADLNADLGINLADEDVIGGNGSVNWMAVANQIIMSEFSKNDFESVDGVTGHLYSRGTAVPDHRDYTLELIDSTWEAEAEGIETHITEWNVSRSGNLFQDGEHFGLVQAKEMLEVVQEFVDHGVNTAHVWPVLQNTANSLSKGFSYEKLTPAGEMFNFMAETIPGKVMLDFSPSQSTTDAEFEDVSVHAFYGDGEISMFVVSNSDGVSNTDIDFSSLVSGFSASDVKVLGVASGENFASNDSSAVVEVMDSSEVIEDGFIEAILGPHEIMLVTLSGVQPTPEFSDLIDAAGLSPIVPPKDFVIKGAEGDDALTGTQDDDLARGYDGDDSLMGEAGNDTLNGGKGDDLLAGGKGNDDLRGHDGDDVLYGNEGDDTLTGLSGHDVLWGHEGEDVIYGEYGDDTIFAGEGDDTIDAGHGKNLIWSGSGNDDIRFSQDDSRFETRIMDFDPKKDKISLEIEGVNSVEDFSISRNDDAEHLIVSLMTDKVNGQIILEGEFGDEELDENEFLTFL